MSRTSKRGLNAKKGIMTQDKLYSVGIYARLSVDGDERKSESIETQLDIAKAFLRKQRDMVLYDCYIDLGKSGTNFAREGFERMMQDVRLCRIDCILVKDLSRFGRNHIEAGNYIEKIFPFLGVRFIAVADHFDSMKASAGDENLGVSLKNLVNEMYARDIAIKIKSGKRVKWEQGSYIGGILPYGYRAEWIDGKKCLFPEETTSDIVRKIYDLFLSGKSMKEIRVWLYEQRIQRPGSYRKSGHIYGQEGEDLKEWSAGTIKWLLTNPVYTGCLVQGITCARDYQKRHEAAAEDWAVREHTHEAIISEDIFIRAALRFEQSSKYSNKAGFSRTIPLEEDIFSDVLFCGECGGRLRRISGIKELGSGHRLRRYYYDCPSAGRIDESRCEKKYISKEALVKLVKLALYQELSLSSIRPKDLIERNCKEAERQKAVRSRRLRETEKAILCITRLCSEQYAGYRMGELGWEKFAKAKEENNARIAALQKKKEEIADSLKSMDMETVHNNRFLRRLFKCSEKTELTAEVIQALIYRIEVYPDQRVRVIFAFRQGKIPERKGGRI